MISITRIFMAMFLLFPVQQAWAVESNAAVVVIDNKFERIRSGYDSSAAYSYAMDAGMRSAINSFNAGGLGGPSYGQAMGAGLVGGLIAGAIIADAEQKAADDSIASLTSLATEDELEEAIHGGIRDAISASMNISDVQFFRTSASSAGFDPITLPESKQASLAVVLSASGMPITLTKDRRSMSIALNLEQYAKRGSYYKKIGVRKITLITAPDTLEVPTLALQRRVGLGKEDLLKTIRQNISAVLFSALSIKEEPVVEGNELVNFINAGGAFVVPGKIIEQKEGQIVVADYKGNLGFFAADIVL